MEQKIQLAELLESIKNSTDTSTWPFKPESFPAHLNPFEYAEKGFLTPRERADRLRVTYPKKCSSPNDTFLYRFVDNETGIRTNSDGIATFWQSGDLNFNYSGEWLIVRQ